MDETLQISYNNTDKENSKNNELIDNIFTNLTFSDIGTNEKMDEINSINSIISNNKLDDFNDIFNGKKKSKIKKEELNNIPIPIFSCIYCSNEKIVFTHMINKIIEKKYLLLTSKNDMKILDELIKKKTIQNLQVENQEEYIKKYYKYKESKLFLNKSIEAKKDKLINIINYPTNSSTSINTTSVKFKIDEIIREQTERITKIKNNKRKITKKDIIWDKIFYNIWDPIPEPVFLYNKNDTPRKNKNGDKNTNRTPILNRYKKLNLNLYSKYKIQGKEISSKNLLTYRNKKMLNDKSFQKLFIHTYSNNKPLSKNKNINSYNKHSITNLITKNNSKNTKNHISVNITTNATPIKNISNYNNKNDNIKILLKSTNIKNISNDKNKKNYINLNPKNVFNSSKMIFKSKILSAKKQNFSKKINPDFYTQNSSIYNKEKLDEIRVVKKINKNSLIGKIPKNIKTYKKIQTLTEKNIRNISPQLPNGVSFKTKNLSNDKKKKIIEIYINNIK